MQIQEIIRTMRAYTTNDFDGILTRGTIITTTPGAEMSPKTTSITDYDRESGDLDDFQREMVQRPSEVMVVDFNKST